VRSGEIFVVYPAASWIGTTFYYTQEPKNRLQPCTASHYKSACGVL